MLHLRAKYFPESLVNRNVVADRLYIFGLHMRGSETILLIPKRRRFIFDVISLASCASSSNRQFAAAAAAAAWAAFIATNSFNLNHY